MSASASINAAAWSGGRYLGAYSTADLRPVEAQLLDALGDDLSGRVLELGCGAGRVTGHLAARARELLAMDISQRMLDRCARNVPGVRYHHGDIAHLSTFAEPPFDAVVATFNVVDVLDDAERRALLDEVRRVLVPGGVLVFSSHNRGIAPQIKAPWQLPTHRLLALGNAVVRLPLRMRNRHRLRRHEVHDPGYLIVNDSAHDYGLLHYYVSPSAQRDSWLSTASICSSA